MNHTEQKVIVACGMVGAVALWFWSSSFPAACVYLATAALLGESLNAIVWRLESIRRIAERTDSH
jgi:hypothetical protein